MTARVYRMPSTSGERAQLVQEITLLCSLTLGYPAREANISNWMAMGMVELRMCHALWVKTWDIIKSRRESLPTKVNSRSGLREDATQNALF